MPELTNERYGRALRWTADGREYIWAIDRGWVQDVGHLAAVIDEAVETDNLGPMLSGAGFITTTFGPGRLSQLLSAVDLSQYPELLEARAALVTEANRKQAVYDRHDAEYEAKRNRGCSSTLLVLAVLVCAAHLPHLV